MPHRETDPALQHMLCADMQPQPEPGEVPLLAHHTSIVTLERIAVERMLEIYQPAWASRVARSSTPYRAQR